MKDFVYPPGTVARLLVGTDVYNSKSGEELAVMIEGTIFTIVKDRLGTWDNSCNRGTLTEILCSLGIVEIWDAQIESILSIEQLL